MTNTHAPPATMTAAEFLALPESSTPVELFDGEVVMTPAPTAKHQRLILNIAVVLRELVPEGELYIAPIDVCFDDDNTVQPDVLWVAPDSTACTLVNDHYWQGAPDLIVEVLSPATAHRDRGKKFDLYERHGVREYWLVDPDARIIEVYRHTGDHFARIGVFGPEDTLETPLFPAKPVMLASLLTA